MKFEAHIETFRPELGGRNTPFPNNSTVTLALSDAEVLGTITMNSNIKTIAPGEDAGVIVEVSDNTPISFGDTFMIKDAGELIGAGKINKLL